MAGADARLALLLVEPESVLRRTVAGVSRDLGLADVHEATSVEVAQRMLHERSFDALFIALDASGAALELLAALRAGQLSCGADTPVAVLAQACDAALALRLKELAVRRLLLKPFKVKGVLETIAALAAARSAAAQSARGKDPLPMP